MAIIYSETGPLYVTVPTSYGMIASNCWVFFKDGSDDDVDRTAFIQNSSGAISPAPNPIQLTPAGTFPATVLFKFDNDNPDDSYTLIVRGSNSTSSPILSVFNNVPRTMKFLDASAGGFASLYPDPSTSLPGLWLATVPDPAHPGKSKPEFKDLPDALGSQASQMLSNSVVTGFNITIPSSADSLTVAEGVAIFVKANPDHTVASSTMIKFNASGTLTPPEQTVSWLYLVNDGTYHILNAVEKDDPYGDKILLAVIYMDNLPPNWTISRIMYRTPLLRVMAHQIRNLYDTIGLNSSCIPSINSSVSALDITGGEFTGYNVDPTNQVNPDKATITAATAVPVKFVNSYGTIVEPPASAITEFNLVLDNGVAVAAGKAAYFPIFQASNGSIIIQRTDKDFDEIPEFEEWYESFQVAPNILKTCAIIGGILYNGKTAGLLDPKNKVFRVKQFVGGGVANIGVIEGLPMIPADASKARHFVIVKKDNSAYGHSNLALNEDVIVDRYMLIISTEDPDNPQIIAVPIPISESSSTVPYDRQVSVVMQKAGVLAQRRDIDYIPPILSDYVDFRNYSGNYMADISRGYATTFTNNTTADGSISPIFISSLFNNIIENSTSYSSPVTGHDVNGKTHTFYNFYTKKSYHMFDSFNDGNRNNEIIDASWAYGVDYLKTIVEGSAIPQGTIVIYKGQPGKSAVAYAGTNTYVTTTSTSSTLYGNSFAFYDYSATNGLSLSNTSGNPIKVSLVSSNQLPVEGINADVCFFAYKLLPVSVGAVNIKAVIKFPNLTADILSEVLGGKGTHHNYSYIGCYTFTIKANISCDTNTPCSIVKADPTGIEFGDGFGFCVTFSSRRIGSQGSSTPLIPAVSSFVVAQLNSSGDIVVPSSATNVTIDQMVNILKNGIKFSTVISGPTTYHAFNQALTDNRLFYVSYHNMALGEYVPPVNGYPITYYRVPNGVVEVEIDGLVFPSGSPIHSRLDSGKIVDFNVAADGPIIKKGLRADNIVPGDVLFSVTFTLKSGKTPLEYMEKNPHNLKMFPFVLSLVDGSTETSCTMCGAFVGRYVYYATVTQHQIDNAIVALRIYPKGSLAPDYTQILEHYDVQLGICNRTGSN